MWNTWQGWEIYGKKVVGKTDVKVLSEGGRIILKCKYKNILGKCVGCMNLLQVRNDWRICMARLSILRVFDRLRRLVLSFKDSTPCRYLCFSLSLSFSLSLLF